MAQITVRMSDELLGKVEAARGDVPRERWVRKALEQALDPSPERAAPEATGSGVAAGEPERPAPAQAPIDRAAMFRGATQ